MLGKAFMEERANFAYKQQVFAWPNRYVCKTLDILLCSHTFSSVNHIFDAIKGELRHEDACS